MPKNTATSAVRRLLRRSAQALDTTELIANEPVTVILSQKGWIRAAKGYDIEVETLATAPGMPIRLRQRPHHAAGLCSGFQR